MAMSSSGPSLASAASARVRRRSRWRLAGASLLLASVLSCGGKDSPTAPNRVPSGLAVASGDQQQAVVASDLTAPLVVKVVDQNDAPLAGQTVNFSVVRGGGHVDPASAVTSADGLAQARWTLGTSADTQVVEARLGTAGASAMTVRFRAMALPAAPSAIHVVSGDAQHGLPGSVLDTPIVVQLVDQYGNAVPGRRVDFSVGAGGGSIAPASATTDSAGRAQAQWSLGDTPGAKTATAVVNGLPAASFTATVEALHLNVITGTPASGTVGAALPQPIVVRVTNDAGAPVQGISVVFASVLGGGTLSPSPAVTDVDGRASAQWVLGTASGRDSATASIRGADAVGFGVNAVPGVPAHVSYVSGSGQTGTVDAILGAPLVVRVTDQYGNLVKQVNWSTVTGQVVQDSVAANGNLYASWKVTRVGTDTAVAFAGSDTVHFVATVGPMAGPTLTLQSNLVPPFTVARPLAVYVQLRDANGAAVQGATVTWTITAGAGSFSDIANGATPITTTTTTTDQYGSTFAYWTLGKTIAVNTLDVRTAGADPLTVSVTSTADRTCESGINGGSGSTNYIGSGMVGTILPTVLTPYSFDRWGNATTDVYFLPSVPDGGEVIRMSDGTLRIRLGTRAGSVEMRYYFYSCQGYPTPAPRQQLNAFTATATPGPASTIAITGGDNQTAVAGTQLSTPLSVSLADQFGNATTGNVTWSVASGGGSITGTGTSVRWTLGTTAGAQSVTATLDNGASVTFHATALAGAPTTIAVAGGDGQTAPAGSTLPSPLVVRLTDAYGNPTSGVTVTWTVTAGGGSITASSVTGADGRASAQWTLGTTPGPNGASAGVGSTTLAPATFTATGS